MLASVQRTRTRRRLAMIAPAAALVVAVAASLTTPLGTCRPARQSLDPPRPRAPRQWRVTPTGSCSGPATRCSSTRRTCTSRRSETAPRPPGPRTIGGGGTGGRHPDHRRALRSDAEALVSGLHGDRMVTRRRVVRGHPGRPGRFQPVARGREHRRSRPVALDGIRGLRSLTWAPDSRTLAFLATSPAANQGGWTVSTEGSRPQQFLDFPTRRRTTRPVAPLCRCGGRRRRPASRPRRHPEQLPSLTRPTPVGRDDDAPRRGYVESPARGRTLRLCRIHPEPRMVARWKDPGCVLPQQQRDRQPPRRGRATVRVRFLPGASGPLSWQPLPNGP